MSVKPWGLLLAVAAAHLVTVVGYKNGKVTVSCKSMRPQHSGTPSPMASPYTITVDKTKFSPGDQIEVTLSVSTPESVQFKGFLIEARDTAALDGEAVGSFKLLDPSISQLLDCGSTQGSATSHTSAIKKTKIGVVWNAPRERTPDSVQFLASVVQHYNIYWVKIPGPVVSQNGVTPPPPKPTTVGTTVGTTAPSLLPGPFSSEGCGHSKSCLRDPVGCEPEIDPQCFFLSFATEDETTLFQLSGPADGYVSFSLSLDQWMGNDDGYLCVRNRDRVDIDAAYFSGRTHPELASQSELTDKAWRLSDEIIQCSFRRKIHIPQDQTRFDLDQRYYLFMAHGRAEDGMIHRHNRQPLISTRKTCVSGAPENLTGSRSPLIMKFHGAFMLLAWMSTVSTGVIIARHFKNDWQERTLFGQKLWFQVHRALMTVTVLLCCGGFALPFFYRGGWSHRAGAHAYIGCIIMGLTVLQPLMASIRPSPDSSRRYLFNWLHFSVGRTAEILAWAAMFLGIRQQSLLLPAPLSTNVLVGSLVWRILAELALQLHGSGLLKIGKHSNDDGDQILSDTPETGWRDALFKNVVLVCFVTGNVGFLIALWVAVCNV